MERTLEHHGTAVSTDPRLVDVLNRLKVIKGCAEHIERDTRNSPDARRKGVTMARDAQAVIDTLTALSKDSGQ